MPTFPWDFIILDCLVDFGLPGSLLRVIIKCVASASMYLEWDVQLTEPFSPLKGIRHAKVTHVIIPLCY
ncbi:conserved hypothetical protein [Ricinus communis]|uniref:Uncharacterized protein n=1 Tax=Ricinus communis TaxID=3988 RepID=B9R7L7_RICCO|nr:conserved hypothetical protein [Ricinus communis]